jgi:hypothetical protein
MARDARARRQSPAAVRGEDRVVRPVPVTCRASCPTARGSRAALAVQRRPAAPARTLASRWVPNRHRVSCDRRAAACQLADAVAHDVDQSVVGARGPRRHRAGHIDGHQEVRPAVSGVPAGEHVVDVVWAQRRPAASTAEPGGAGRRAATGAAQAGPGERPSAAGPVSAADNRPSAAAGRDPQRPPRWNHQLYRRAAVWSRGASTTDPRRDLPDHRQQAYSGTSPTSPGARGSAGAASTTVRVRGSAVAAPRPKRPSRTSPTARRRRPAPSMPSPDPPGSRTAGGPGPGPRR